MGEFSVTDPEILAAGLLHDILEDTPTSVSELEERFPTRVVRLVSELSHPPHPNSEEKAAYLKRLPLLSEDAKLVKLADLLANIRQAAVSYTVTPRKALLKYPNTRAWIATVRDFLDSCPSHDRHRVACVEAGLRSLEQRLPGSGLSGKLPNRAHVA